MIAETNRTELGHCPNLYAISHFREAVQCAPHRYESHEGLVDCYMAQGRHREAVSAATTACKSLNNSPRSLTLLARVLHKDPLQLSMPKAKVTIEAKLQFQAGGRCQRRVHYMSIFPYLQLPLKC